MRDWYRRQPQEKRQAIGRRQRDRDPETVRARDRARHHARKSDPTYAVKRDARTALNAAVRAGAVSRGPCEVCGDPQTDGHHEDYSRPLDVRWLCRRHHAREHRTRTP